MKKHFLKIIDFISVLFKPILNIKTIVLFRYVKNRLVWNCFKSKLKKVGKNSNCGSFPKLQGCEYIEIGDNFRGGNNLSLECWDSYRHSDKQYTPKLIIGNNITFTSDTQISCLDKVVIGDNCLFGRYVYISDNSHGKNDYSDLDTPPLERELSSKGPVIIGKNVWIGRCSTILSGVTIGDNAIIGANSVVNKDVPSNVIVAGVPAKIVKKIDLYER